MKKFFILIFALLLICGCTRIKNESIDHIINISLTDNHIHTNMVRLGFKYYRPLGLSVVESSNYNEILRGPNNIIYYLYTDVVSYYNKVSNSYKVNSNSYESRRINFQDKSGYLEINKTSNNEYLIEIMYNYAKIEVIVDEEFINEALSYSMSILSSIEYNDKVIENMLSEAAVNLNEEGLDIFKTKSQDSNYLKYVEDNKYDKDVIPDMDLVS